MEIREDIMSMEDKGLEETVKIVENKESGRKAKKTVWLTVSGQVGKVQTAVDSNERKTLHTLWEEDTRI